MSVTTDIVQSWRQPRQVIRRHLARGKSEPFAFSLLIAFLILAFIAQWPRLSRLATMTPEVPMVQGLVGSGLALLAAIPLLYGLAALGHLVARAMGGKGGFYGARLALFLALLGASPFVLLHGMVLGLLGTGLQATLVGSVAFAVFATLWLIMLSEAER